MAHFSKYIRPGAKRVGVSSSTDEILVTAAENPDGSIVLIVFNEDNVAQELELS